MVILNRNKLQAWIDKLWYDETKKRLSEWGVLSNLQKQAKEQELANKPQITTQLPQITDSPVFKNTWVWENTSWLEWVKGYEQGQVWIPWVNLWTKTKQTIDNNQSLYDKLRSQWQEWTLWKWQRDILQWQIDKYGIDKVRGWLKNTTVWDAYNAIWKNGLNNNIWVDVPKTDTSSIVINPDTGRADNSNLINSANNSWQLNTDKGITDFLNTPNPNAKLDIIADLNKKTETTKITTWTEAPTDTGLNTKTDVPTDTFDTSTLWKTWNAWLDILSDTASSLKTNLETELANLEQQKAWLWTALTETWKLTDEEQKAVLDPYEQFLDKVTKLQDINKAETKRDQDYLKTSYNQTIDRQKKANELALTNAQKIAAITGVWFTSWWIQGISNIIDEWTQAISDLEQERENMLYKYQDLDNKLDIEYLDTITTVQKESKQALQDRYNSVITQIQKIDADKWKATKEWLTEIKNVVKEYFDALDKQWQRDFKVMDFNYKKFTDYKQDLREDEKIVREQQQQDLELLKEWNLTWLTDEEITNLWADMDLDKWAIQWLILLREEQKRKNQFEQDKFALETKKATEMTPAQQAQYNLDVQKFWLDQAKFNLENGVYETVWWDLTSQIDAQKWNDTNVWKWTNNPWNIMWDSQAQRDYATRLWAVWFYNSKNGRTYAVFPDKTTGENALASDLQTKLNWWSSWATKNTSLADFAKWWTNWPNGAPNPWATNNMIKYLKQNWVNVSSATSIWQIDPKLLANAVQYNEGTLWKEWPNWSKTTTSLEDYKPTQNDINKFTYSEKLTPNEQNTYLKSEWLLDKYLQYNQDRTTKKSWLLEWVSSIQDITFPEKTTEFKTKSYNYGTRMDEANKMLKNMEDKYKKSWSLTEYLAPKWEWVPNFLKTDDRQQFEQAQRNFINSVLRQESWAVISDQEFDNAKKQYFPAPWDWTEVLNQKRQNREMAIYNMLKASGKDEQWRDIWNIWKELNLKKAPVKPKEPTWWRITTSWWRIK